MIAVVGAGFWGTAIALALRERGHSVVLFDDRGEGASSAAAGLVQKAWYAPQTLTALRLPDWWGMEYARAGWELLIERCDLERVGEWFGTRANPTLRWREDLWMVPGPGSLLSLAGLVTEERVLGVAAGGGEHVWVTTSEQHATRFDWAVLAAGVRTDDLLPTFLATGVTRLPGRAFLTTSGPPDGIPHTYLGAPYRHMTWRPWVRPLNPGGGRIGDTVERSVGAAPAWRKYAFDALRRMGGSDLSVVGELYGVRPVLKKILVEQVASRLIVATGGHRVGLALAGGVARRVVQLVEGEK